MDAVLSRALLRGFITAVGFIIFIEQSSRPFAVSCFREQQLNTDVPLLVVPLLGLEGQAQLHHIGQETPIDKLIFVIEHVSRIHKLTACISIVCLILLVSAKIVKPKISRKHKWINYVPEILIVVVVATGEPFSDLRPLRIRRKRSHLVRSGSPGEQAGMGRERRRCTWQSLCRCCSPPFPYPLRQSCKIRTIIGSHQRGRESD